MPKKKKNQEVLDSSVDVIEEEISNTIDSDDSIQHDFEKFMTKVSKIDKGAENNLVIPTGIDLLDTVLGGGIGMKFSMLIGLPGSGKSALSTRILKMGQQLYGNDFIGIYADSEETMTMERLAELGITKPKIEPVREVSVEKIFKIIESICAYKENHKDKIHIPSVVVWDSIANTHTESMLDSEELSQTMGAQKAKVIAHYLPIYITKMNKYNITLLSVNQLRDEINMDGNKYNKPPKDLKFLKHGQCPGGKSVLYNAFQLLEVSQKSMLTNEKGENIYGFDGIEVQVSALKNKLFKPNIPVKLVFSFSNGFSNFWTNFQLLCDYKYITTGAWFELKSCPKQFRKINGISLYKENPEWKEAFDKDVKDILQTEFVNKFKNNEELLD